MRILSRLLVCLLLVGLIAVDIAVFTLWLPHKREVAAANELETLSVRIESRPLFPPLPCNLIRKIVPKKHTNVCNRVRKLTLPKDGFSDGFRNVLTAHAPRLTFVREIDAANSALRGDLLLGLSDSLPRLRRLRLDNAQIDDEGLDALKFYHLTHLTLADTPIGDRALAYLVRLRELRQLDLSGTAVSFRGLAELESLPRLERLELRGILPQSNWRLRSGGMPQLREVFLAHVALTDQDVGKFTDWANGVEYLDLSNTHITDGGIESLPRLPRLHTINLAGTRVTRAGAKGLTRSANLKLLVCDSDVFSRECLDELDVVRPDLVVFRMQAGSRPFVRRNAETQDPLTGYLRDREIRNR